MRPGSRHALKGVPLSQAPLREGRTTVAFTSKVTFIRAPCMGRKPSLGGHFLLHAVRVHGDSLGSAPLAAFLAGTAWPSSQGSCSGRISTTPTCARGQTAAASERAPKQTVDVTGTERLTRGQGRVWEEHSLAGALPRRGGTLAHKCDTSSGSKGTSSPKGPRWSWFRRRRLLGSAGRNCHDRGLHRGSPGTAWREVNLDLTPTRS